MTFRIAGIAAVFTATIALTACDDSEIRTGPVRTETREVGSFDSIEVAGTARLEISVGSPVSLEVEGRDPFLQRLRTEVHGDTLQIKSHRKDWISVGTSPRLTLRISVPKLESLRLEGGNDVQITGFNGGDTEIRIEGAAHLKATGRLDELTVDMMGAGHADLSKLVADDAKVTVSGVGSIFVHPKETLEATMNGVGAILYTGSPREVNTHMNGLGTIGRRDAKDRPRSRDDADPPPPIDPDSLQPEYDNPDEKAEGASGKII